MKRKKRKGKKMQCHGDKTEASASSKINYIKTKERNE